MAKGGFIKDTDKGWKNMIRVLSELDGQAVDVGYITDSEITAIAAFNEFGTRRGIPSRPFMSDYFDRNKDKIQRFAGGQMKRVADRKISATEAMQAIGVYVKGGIQKNIRNGNWAPNAPSTIRKKGSARPLIDEGHLLKSVEVEVRKGGRKR